MDEDILEMILAFVAGMTALFCTTAIILTIIKRRPSRLSEPDVGRRLDDISDRLSRLDTSIDAMAVEVERISESQRFTAKVLIERGNTPILPDKSRSGSTTPH
jgi:hypothetical protein